MSGDEREVPAAPSAAPSLSAFKDSLHSSYVVGHAPGGPVTLTLEEIKAGGARPGWESFSLIFDGPSPPAFWDGLFEVAHPDLGAFALFLVAVQTDGDGQQYQAVFNRPTT
jgi:hypothetical protein